jgi:hypothetical protein
MQRPVRATAFAWLFAGLLLPGCGPSEDPGRAALRARLRQEARLSSDELASLREEIARAMTGKAFWIKEGADLHPMDDEQRVVVFGLLHESAGMYDEGLRRDARMTFRVLNAPGRSRDSEVEAARHLWVEVETFLPRRFQFTYAFPGYGDYAFDLVDR